MTTAHRPTFVPAMGGQQSLQEGKLGAISKQYSVRDQKSHAKLKHRQIGQGTESEYATKDFKADLEEKERLHFNKRKANEQGAIAEAQDMAEKRLKAIEAIDPDLDADDVVDDDNDSSDSDDDDDDDEAELLRELQKIKQERADEAQEKEMQKADEADQVRTEVYSSGNPLLNNNADFNINRRWDDGVVFKNCAKKIEDKGEFVNDTLRSVFHRKFMDKYVR